MSLPRSVRFNYDDFLLFPEDGKRHEIIDGDHFMTPSPNTKHQRVSGNLFNALTNFLKARKSGEAFAAPLDVRTVELAREANETLRTPLLPDFQIPLTELFE